MSATDADDDLNGKVLYFLSRETHGAFTVDENTGRITTAAPLDREKWASYNFQVFAVDLSPAAPRNSSAQVNEVLETGVFCVYFYAHNIISNIPTCDFSLLGDSHHPGCQRQHSFLHPGSTHH